MIVALPRVELFERIIVSLPLEPVILSALSLPMIVTAVFRELATTVVTSELTDLPKSTVSPSDAPIVTEVRP